MKLLPAACSVVFLLAACADEVTPEWVVEMSASDLRLPADGSLTSNITVGVFDSASGDAPVGAGEPVLVRCLNSASAASGFFAGFDVEGEADALTDGVGLASFRYACAGDTGSDYSVNCVALAKQSSGQLRPGIECLTSGIEE